MFDFIIYYLLVGWVVNSIVAIFIGRLSDYEAEFDVVGYLSYIPFWPLTLWDIVSSFFSNED